MAKPSSYAPWPGVSHVGKGPACPAQGIGTKWKPPRKPSDRRGVVCENGILSLLTGMSFPTSLTNQ